MYIYHNLIHLISLHVIDMTSRLPSLISNIGVETKSDKPATILNATHKLQFEVEYYSHLLWCALVHHTRKPRYLCSTGSFSVDV